MAKTPRGQSVMEFMMTYGWAILVIVIILAVLFYLGVLNPRGATGNTCLFSPGHSCYTFKVGNGTGQLDLDFGQATGKTALVTGISCSENGSAPFTSLTNQVTVPSGEHRWVAGGNSGNIINCTSQNGTALLAGSSQPGDRYKGKVCVNYTETGTGTTRIVCGDVTARLEPAGPTSGQDCAPCNDGSACTSGSQCSSGGCSSGWLCQSTCGDAVCNGTETKYNCAVDCGPPSQACGFPNPSTCGNGLCENTLCASPAEGCDAGSICPQDCGVPAQSSGQNYCQPCTSSCPVGASCSSDDSCIYFYCDPGTNKCALAPNGYYCENDSWCQSGYCDPDSQICWSPPVGCPVTLSTPGQTYTLSQDYSGSMACIIITADNVTVDCQGHTITGAQSGLGISVSSANRAVINNCIVTNETTGIRFYNSNNGNITGNTVSNSTSDGIYLGTSNNNTLSGNTANSNGFAGIHLYSSSNYNAISSNTATSNNYGIYIESSNNNTLSGNTANLNSYNGIRLADSSNYNNLTGNIANSSEYGISLYSSSNNNLTGNTANNNTYRGIYFYYSSNNTLTSNSMSGSGNFDIYCDSGVTNTTRTSNTCSTSGKACSGCNTPPECNATQCN